MISGADGGHDLRSFLAPSGEVNFSFPSSSWITLKCLRSFFHAAYHSRVIPVCQFGCTHSVRALEAHATTRRVSSRLSPELARVGSAKRYGAAVRPHYLSNDDSSRLASSRETARA